MVYSVYFFMDSKGKPYYVGKTNNMNRRRKEHLKEIEDGNPLPKYAKARALIKSGHKLKMKRVAQFSTENAALEKERMLIRKYRKKPGIKLTNLTTGGKNERPTDLKGRRRKASWYVAPKKKRLKKNVRKKINKKRKRR